MILSAVINLTPTIDMPIPASLGHKAQGWLLNEIHSYLPSLAERLHQQGGYTVSGVHRQLKGRSGRYYLRITSLVSDLTGAVQASGTHATIRAGDSCREHVRRHSGRSDGKDVARVWLQV